MREDKIHQQVKQYLLKAGLKQGVDFEEYVTKNPDYIFEIMDASERSRQEVQQHI